MDQPPRGGGGNIPGKQSLHLPRDPAGALVWVRVRVRTRVRVRVRTRVRVRVGVSEGVVGTFPESKVSIFREILQVIVYGLGQG